MVPAHNAERTLADTLSSLTQQTYPQIEIWVVDDGSTDGTYRLAAEAAAGDSRIHVVRQPKSGVAIARNSGVAQARGEWVAPVDADDLWHPDAAARMLRVVEQSASDVGVVYAWSAYIDDCGWPMSGYKAASIAGWVGHTFLCHNFIGNASATLMRRDRFLEVGGYDPLFFSRRLQGCEDWDLYLRLAERVQFAVVPEFLVAYRKSPVTMSANSQRMADSHEAMLMNWRRLHTNCPYFLFTFSRASFALYLAQEARRRGDLEEARDWCYVAQRHSPWLARLRPAYYVNCGLFSRFAGRRHERAGGTSQVPRAESTAQRSGEGARVPESKESGPADHAAGPTERATSAETWSALQQRKIHRGRLYGILAIQSAFHRLITARYGQPRPSTR